MFGYMGKILRVNLTTGTISEEFPDEDTQRKYLGGIGFATKYLFEEVPKGADPFGPDNELIFMTGALTGTASGNLVSGGALGTPSSGTLTNCTIPTLNQSTTGNAATAAPKPATILNHQPVSFFEAK